MVEYQEMKNNSDWYYANLDALLPKYNRQYVAIADRSVFGAFAECIDGVRSLPHVRCRCDRERCAEYAGVLQVQGVVGYGSGVFGHITAPCNAAWPDAD